MLYIVDTANLEDIRRCTELYPISGVTTNPTIISKENAGFPELIKSIRSIIGPDSMFHIQTTGATAQDMVREAKLLQDYIGGNFYIKVPLSPEGLKATIALKKQGIQVTETAIFTQQQAMLAARAGADFVAPYINRLDNIVSDGVHVASEIVKMFKVHALDCKVLAASFRNVEQVHKIAMAGTHAVTVAPKILDALIYHPMTLSAIDDFNADWKSVYGEASIEGMLQAEGSK